MKIALFCSSRNKIPPQKTGGTEQPIYYLAKGLAEKGHKVVLYAAKGSKVPGVKVKEISPFVTFKKQEFLNIQERASSFYDLTALSDFFKNEADKFDIIQFNSYIFYEILPFIKFSKAPIIIRINYSHHLLYPYIRDYLKKYKEVYYLPISSFIKTVMPNLKYTSPIYPAVDMSEFGFSDNPKDQLLFIGRISPKKGAHLAIKAAIKSKKKLILAGKIEQGEGSNYFNDMIKPYVDNKNIVYLGEVGFKAKIKLYKQSRATLFPIEEPEGFGNVQIESMSCGTPVVAFDRGANREAIKNNYSGYLARNFNQLVEAIKKIEKLDRTKVRKWAEENFSLEKYINKHEELYKKIAK